MEVANAKARYKEAAKLDPFVLRYPPKGALPQPSPDRLALCGLPTGDVLSISKANELNLHVGIFGASGGGKTNMMRILAAQCLNDAISVVVLDSKEDFTACSSLRRENVRVLAVDGIPLALLQPPPEQTISEFVDNFSDIFARSLGIYASRLYLIDQLHALYQQTPHPSYRQLLSLVEKERPERNYGSIADYRERILAFGKLIHYSLGDVVDYANSDALDEIFSHRGVTVIRCSQLSNAVRTFYASYLLNYIFQRRRNPKNVTHLVVVILDDAQELLSGGVYQEATDRYSPIVSRALDARSRRIGLVAGLQSFSHTSPAFKQQCSTMIFTAARGEDAHAIQRWLGLSSEETGKLQNLMPGEVVCRTALFGVQYGRVPRLA
jgi:DNA helicase HerA-like ATPase